MILKGVFRKVYEKRNKHVRLIPDFLTYFNACFGFLSVVSALQGNFTIAAWLIACALLCDACDGRLARALGTASFVGQELDALADAVSFCCAPAILLYVFCNSAFIIIPSLAYLCAGLFRLARFNAHKPESGLNYFIGLPTPMAAITIASLVMYLATINERSGFYPVELVMISAVVGGLAFLMQSAILFPTCKGRLVSAALFRLLGVVGSGVLFLGWLGVPFWLSLPFGYLLGSLFLAFFARVRKNF